MKDFLKQWAGNFKESLKAIKTIALITAVVLTLSGIQLALLACLEAIGAHPIAYLGSFLVSLYLNMVTAKTLVDMIFGL